jgi:hypothetical protein
MALLPIRIFFQGEDRNFALFDGRLNPCLLILPIFAFAFARKKDNPLLWNEKIFLLAFAALYFLFAFFSSVLRIRYLSPMIPPLVVLSVYGVRDITVWVQKIGSVRIRKAGIAFVGVMLTGFIGLNGQYIQSQFDYVNPLPYIRGDITRDDYITRYRAEYPAMRYINQHLPDDALIMFIYVGKRGYYCDREYLSDMADTFIHIVRSGQSAGQICDELKNRRVTHLLIYIGILNEWLDDLFNPEEQNRLEALFADHLSLLFYDRGFGVYEVMSDCHLYGYTDNAPTISLESAAQTDFLRAARSPMPDWF